MLKSKSSPSKNASEFVTSPSLLKIVLETRLESEYPDSRIRDVEYGHAEYVLYKY